jgi:hypothetical protein
MFDNFHSALTTPFTAGYAEEGDKINLSINNPLNGGCLDIRRHSIDSVTKCSAIADDSGGRQRANWKAWKRTFAGKYHVARDLKVRKKLNAWLRNIVGKLKHVQDTDLWFLL